MNLAEFYFLAFLNTWICIVVCLFIAKILLKDPDEIPHFPLWKWILWPVFAASIWPLWLMGIFYIVMELDKNKQEKDETNDKDN